MFCTSLLTLALCAAPQGSQQQPEKENQTDKAPHEIVIVTAAKLEQPVGAAVSFSSAITKEDLEQTPALTLDDHLRRIPGFSLFRRSSSLSTHPTAQGVSLRGIGPSGTSRSLVLFDGIPLNDPFGGWVYWNRIPLLALEAVEVVRGATSQLYGNSALGGTIQLIPRAPDSKTVEIRGQAGSRRTYDLDFFGSDKSGPFAYLVSGRLFDTDGFFIVDDSQRGAVDRPARSDFQTFFGRFFYKNFHAGVNLFQERRDNGTELQENSTRIQMFESGFQTDAWEWDFYAQSTRFKSTFSRILPDRSREFLTASQDFPFLGLGSSLTWRPASRILVGTDWQYVDWEEKHQNRIGLFVQDLLAVHPRLDLLLGARLDFWESEELQTTVNPRAGLLYRASNAWTVRASAYRGFRAPTLNELYRPFRVGNVETLANPALREESLWGADMGGDFHPTNSVLVRLNVFWNSLRDPVNNVTLSTTPSLILRQRRNLGRANISGVEAEAMIALSPRWEIHAAYLFSGTEVDGSGLRLPQVPKHQAVAGVQYKGPVIVTADSRWVGSQFDDDLNRLQLGSYALVDVMARRPLTERLDLFVAVENLLDRDYAVGRTPIQTLGTPRLVHGGLMFRIGR